MCSGGGPSANDLAREQTRAANIAKIKAAQKARLGQIDVVGGGNIEEYRRSMADGAKDVGQTSEDIANQRMSDLFANQAGQGAIIARRAAWRRAALRRAREQQGGGGGEGAAPGPGPGGPGVGPGAGGPGTK